MTKETPERPAPKDDLTLRQADQNRDGPHACAKEIADQGLAPEGCRLF